MPPDWLWIPITTGAALAQTVRNAAQRSHTGLGTLGATLVTFYGLPLQCCGWLSSRQVGTSHCRERIKALFCGLLSARSRRSRRPLCSCVSWQSEFDWCGICKTEVLQIALVGYVLIGDPVSPGAMGAIAASTVGLLLLSPIERDQPVQNTSFRMDHARRSMGPCGRRMLRPGIGWVSWSDSCCTEYPLHDGSSRHTGS